MAGHSRHLPGRSRYPGAGLARELAAADLVAALVEETDAAVARVAGTISH